MAKVKADWAWKNERAKLDLVNAKEASKVVEKFRTSKSFTVKKVQVMVDFWKSEEFYTLYQDFVRSPTRRVLIGGARVLRGYFGSFPKNKA